MKPIVNLAQSLAESALFFGKNYAALSPVEFAATCVDDLFGDRVSISNKTLIFYLIANQMAAGATQGELISELISAFSSVPSTDPNWGIAALHYNTCNATKIVDYLLASTFTQADKAIVADHIVTQMAAGKTFGAMIVWAINTLDCADHGNLVWGNAAALFTNRIEVSKFYSIDKTSTAINPAALQQILAEITADTRTVVTAKTAIDNILDVSNSSPESDCKAFQLNNILEIKESDFLPMPRRISLATESGFLEMLLI